MKIEHLQNGFFEPLRLITVERGYFPDIVDYLPNDQQGFDEAKQVIIDEGKELIEVFNVGNYNSREVAHTNDIIVDMVAVEAAQTGTKSVPDYVENDSGGYDKVMTAHSNYDVTFQITYICYSEKYAAIIERMLTDVFGVRKYLYPYDNDGNQLNEGFSIRRIQSFDTSGDQFIERGYRYMAVNIDLEEGEARDAVAKLEDFSLDLGSLEDEDEIMPE